MRQGVDFDAGGSVDAGRGPALARARTRIAALAVSAVLAACAGARDGPGSAAGASAPAPAPAPAVTPVAAALAGSVADAAGERSLTPAQSSDRAAMFAAMKASADAWNRGDLAGHLAIYDASITTMTKNGPRPTIAAIEASFRANYFAGNVPKQQLSMERLALRFLGPDAALMTGRFVLSGGGLAEQSGWFTLVWVRAGVPWRVVHDHTS